MVEDDWTLAPQEREKKTKYPADKLLQGNEKPTSIHAPDPM